MKITIGKQTKNSPTYMEIKGDAEDSLEIHSYPDGDTEFNWKDDGDMGCLILNQDELKQLIEFLQSKVKKD